jgi:sugar-specific transcriptional regulator TrmB
MNERSTQREAVELLQQLGLKEYEAKSFVALSRQPRGTAREISETSEVPRTRVYDAIRVLEAKGLVETQHTNPKQFRAVPIDEAVETLRAEYEERTEALGEALLDLDPAETGEESEGIHEVWSLSGEAGIRSRVHQLLEESTDEIVLVIGDERVVSDGLIEALRTASDRGVDVVVGGTTESLTDRVQRGVPDAETFVSGLEWLTEPVTDDDRTRIGRLLLVDREAILVSTVTGTERGTRRQEKAVFGRGFDNGLVAIVRRLMATGLARDDGAG